MKKTIVLITLFCLLCSPFYSQTCRAEILSGTSEYAEYNLEEGGTQNFEINTSDGNIAYITISEVVENSRAVSNGTYQISYTSPGAWKAGFKIVVSGNNITSVHSPYYSVITGSILSGRLVKDSSKQASYHLTYKVQGIYMAPGVRCTVSTSSIKVFGI